MRIFRRTDLTEFIYSFCVVLYIRVVTAPMAAKEYTLVRWIEDDTVGVMPLSAVTNESRPCAGDVVDMRWRGKKTYESEILKISSKCMQCRIAIAS